MPRVMMMDLFCIEANGQIYDALLASNRKALTVLQYLILEEGDPVSTQRLCRELWDQSENPESALKTTVSRLRRMLKNISPALADSIVSTRGTYRWCSAEEVTVDVLEILDIIRRLRVESDEDDMISLTEELMGKYRGDLFLVGSAIKGVQLSAWLHGEYLRAVYRLIDIFKRREEYNRILTICKAAQKVDGNDDQLHLELMQALVHLRRTDQLRQEYETLRRRNRRLLGDEDASTDAFSAILDAGESMQLNLDVIRNELIEAEGSTRGPFFCEYTVFKEVYNIYMRNLERLGSTMFLALVMVPSADGKIVGEAMERLRVILHNNMRKGDIIARYAVNVYAMLLPTVNYATGNMVMERLEGLYYDGGGMTPIHTRIAPLMTSPPLGKVEHHS